MGGVVGERDGEVVELVEDEIEGEGELDEILGLVEGGERVGDNGDGEPLGAYAGEGVWGSEGGGECGGLGAAEHLGGGCEELGGGGDIEAEAVLQAVFVALDDSGGGDRHGGEGGEEAVFVLKEECVAEEVRGDGVVGAAEGAGAVGVEEVDGVVER